MSSKIRRLQAGSSTEVLETQSGETSEYFSEDAGFDSQVSDEEAGKTVGVSWEGWDASSGEDEEEEAVPDSRKRKSRPGAMRVDGTLLEPAGARKTRRTLRQTVEARSIDPETGGTLRANTKGERTIQQLMHPPMTDADVENIINKDEVSLFTTPVRPDDESEIRSKYGEEPEDSVCWACQIGLTNDRAMSSEKIKTFIDMVQRVYNTTNALQFTEEVRKHYVEFIQGPANEQIDRSVQQHINRLFQKGLPFNEQEIEEEFEKRKLKDWHWMSIHTHFKTLKHNGLSRDHWRIVTCHQLAEVQQELYDGHMRRALLQDKDTTRYDKGTVRLWMDLIKLRKSLHEDQRKAGEAGSQSYQTQLEKHSMITPYKATLEKLHGGFSRLAGLSETA